MTRKQPRSWKASWSTRSGTQAFAQEWLRRLGAGNPSVTLKAVAAMSQLKTMSVALTPAGQKMEHEIPVNVEDRRRAGLPI